MVLRYEIVLTFFPPDVSSENSVNTIFKGYPTKEILGFGNLGDTRFSVKKIVFPMSVGKQNYNVITTWRKLILNLLGMSFSVPFSVPVDSKLLFLWGSNC